MLRKFNTYYWTYRGVFSRGNSTNVPFEDPLRYWIFEFTPEFTPIICEDVTTPISRSNDLKCGKCCVVGAFTTLSRTATQSYWTSSFQTFGAWRCSFAFPYSSAVRQKWSLRVNKGYGNALVVTTPPLFLRKPLLGLSYFSYLWFHSQASTSGCAPSASGVLRTRVVAMVVPWVVPRRPRVHLIKRAISPVMSMSNLE